MPLPKIAWLVTVAICVIAALILLLSGYDGYAGVVLAVALAAAINLRLTCGPGRERERLARAARWSSGSRWISTSAPRRRAAIPSWSCVGDAVGVLERRAGAELDVQVDVAARAGAAGAQLVVADDAAAGEGLDRGADRGELLGRERLVDEHAPASARRASRPVTTIAPAISSATTGSSHSAPVHCTSARPTSTPSDV